MTDEIKKSTVFISHASEDKDRFVLEFARRLREQGIDAWVDIWEMLPGDSLVDKVFNEGIKNARAMIVVLSEFSVEKPWVREELNLGFINRLSGRCKVIPVVIDDCIVPEALRSTIWQKISNLDDYEREFNRILDAIYGRTNKPPLGPPLAVARRQDLLDDLINNRVQIDSESVSYTQEDMESLLSDKTEPPTIRLQALEIYLSSTRKSAALLGVLLYDPDSGIRRRVMRHIHLKPSPDLFDLLDEKKIKQILGDPELEAAVSATRLACDLVENGKIDRKTLTTVNKHSYWLVRKIAIECIIKLNSPDTLELLYEFRTTSYHVSQRLIRDYIEAHYGEFDDIRKRLAIDLLEHLINARNASEISKSKTTALIKNLYES
jgi:hypothetical protein